MQRKDDGGTKVADVFFASGPALFTSEYRGMEAPDQFADPIGFHLWWESNKCAKCNGVGEICWTREEAEEDWPELLPVISEADLCAACEDCDGSGFRPEVFEV